MAHVASVRESRGSAHRLFSGCTAWICDSVMRFGAGVTHRLEFTVRRYTGVADIKQMKIISAVVSSKLGSIVLTWRSLYT